MSSRTKHIAVKYHFTCNFFGPSTAKHNFLFESLKIGTKEQKADIFTKGLSAQDFLPLQHLLCGL